jgi:hypothetical protein
VRFAVAALAVVTLAGRPVAVFPAQPLREPHQMLRTIGGFTPSQLAALDRGDAIAKVLKTDRREIAVIGAVRIRGPRDRAIARYRDVSNLRKSEIVMQVGTFTRPPRAEDLSTLAFEPYDLDAPGRCTPGDCAVRLSAGAIAHMRGSVQWSAPDARQQSAAAWREMLAGIARGYTTSGDSALPEYANKQEALSVRAELDALYGQFAYLSYVAPEFLRYVREFPRAELEGVENTLYWSKNDLGIRPVMGITHQTVYAPPGRPAFIALKRIYAAHYVDGGLGVTMIADDGTGGFYMTTVDWIRTRSLTSFTRAIVRSIVQDKSRAGVEKMLRTTKQSIEIPIP